jgi:spore maturation protein CgeB
MRLLLAHPGASYSTSDVYLGMSAALRELGHELIEYRLDRRIEAAGAWFKYHQRRAKRRGGDLPYASADVVYKASVEIIERALRFQPDWVLVFSAMYLHPDALIMMRRAGLRVGVLLTESPYDEEKEARILPYVNIAWTNERTSVPRLREMSGNANVEYLPHAYDPVRHYPGLRAGDDAVPAHDVVFVGTFFRERIDTLSAVDWTGINLGLYGDTTPIPARSKLRKHIAGGVTDNALTAALYRRAKIGLNLYRTSKGFGWTAEHITHAESLNPRAYELAASGCFQISDFRREMLEVFPGGSVPSFDYPGGLEWMIRAFLKDESLRNCEAARALNAVQGHTFTARAQQILDGLERVSRPLAVARVG